MMLFVELIVGLLVLGVAVWALNYLLKDYVEGWILAIVNKLVVVLVVVMILYFVLAIFGLVSPPQTGFNLGGGGVH